MGRMNGRIRTTILRAGVASLGMLGLVACGGHNLGDYEFSRRSLAVDALPAPAPELRTGASGEARQDDALGAVIRAGSRIAREVEARRARARLDSAATRIDLARHTAERTLQRAARYLGARPVDDVDRADFLLEVDIRSAGIEVGADQAYLFITAEAILLERATGTEIWAEEVRGIDALTPEADGGGVLPGDILTAGALSTVSVERFERLLQRLADYAADRITRQLREELRDVRG